MSVDGEEFKRFLQKDDNVWQSFCSLSAERDAITLGKIKSSRLTHARYNTSSSKVGGESPVKQAARSF